MDHNPISTIKAEDRKTIERNRRNHMKALCSTLTSLIPRHQSREAVSLQDQLEGAADYIRNLQAKVEKMRRKKSRLTAADWSGTSAVGGMTSAPTVDVCVRDSTAEVVLITGLSGHQTAFTEILRMLHEEGAEVVSASYSVLDNVVVHTIHSQIGECGPDTNGLAARISERLRKFIVYDMNSTVDDARALPTPWK